MKKAINKSKNIKMKPLAHYRPPADRRNPKSNVLLSIGNLSASAVRVVWKFSAELECSEACF